MKNLGTFAIMLSEAVMMMERHAHNGEYGEQEADNYFNQAVGHFYEWLNHDWRFHMVYTTARSALNKVRHDFYGPQLCDEVRAAMAAASSGLIA
jgi:hypothetical protein